MVTVTGRGDNPNDVFFVFEINSQVEVKMAAGFLLADGRIRWSIQKSVKYTGIIELLIFYGGDETKQ